MLKLFRLLLAGIVLLSLLSGLLFGEVVDGRAQSDDNWSGPVNLSGSGSASSPLLVIDTTGVYHSIWIDEVEGYEYSSSTDGLNWAAPIKVNFPFLPADPPPLLLPDQSGGIHVFWQKADKNSVNYGKVTGPSFANPGGWRTTQLAESATAFDVQIDDQGRLYVGYVRNIESASNPAGIYYRQSPDGGISWSSSLRLYASRYMRSVTRGNAHISLAVSSIESQNHIYVVWDDRDQKGIYMTKSADGGLTWEAAKRFKGSEDAAGRASPYNVEVGSSENKVLLTWQTGEPGAPRCSLHSQWSIDGGDQWEDPVRIINDGFVCPETSRFVSVTKDFFVFLLNSPKEISLVAWNGTNWSHQQLQSGASSLLNPVTSETILLGCQHASFSGANLALVGCDERTGGDVWFTSRSLSPIGDWFLPLSGWASPAVVVAPPQRISSLSSVVDSENNIHVFWAQSPSSVYDEAGLSIHYSRWDGERWKFNASIINGFGGLPVDFSPAIDTQNWLLLTWIDGTGGDLLFSWASTEQADITTEWAAPQRLPSPSQWNSSPDILVDATGRIIIAYAVPINEERGIYLLESTDSGQTWSSPRQVFDAVSAGWDMVDQPKIGLDGNGTLHMLFTRYAISKVNRPKGVYYSQSSNGGSTWSEVQAISERTILWSELATYDDQTVHLFWQEHTNSVFANRNQISGDGGVQWGTPFDVTGTGDQETQAIVTMDQSGDLHLIQLVDVDIPTIQDWLWDGSSWIPSQPIQLNGKYHRGKFSLAAGVTSENYLNISVSIDYVDRDAGLKSELVNLYRFLGEAQKGETSLPVVAPTAVLAPALTATELPPASPDQITRPSPTITPSFNNSGGLSQAAIKNIVGLVLAGILIFVILSFVIRRRRK